MIINEGIRRCDIIIIEGIRRSGKTFTIDVIRKYIPEYTLYKDEGIRIATERKWDIDNYATTRDLTYAIFLSKMPNLINSKLIFDRQYLSSYVYGQFYRSTYDKEYWTNHIKMIEEIYDEKLQDITILFMSLTESDFKHMASLTRNKDHLETSEIDSYKRQYELYLEALEISNAKIVPIKAFQTEEYLVKVLKNIMITHNI